MESRPHAHVALGAIAPATVARALDAFCVAERVPQEVAWRLQVALDEVVANLVSHGTPASGQGAVDVWFRRDGPFVEITIADDGPPFNPLERPAPDLGRALDAREAGGLVIFLVRALMDEVRYGRDDRNRLTLRKRIDAHATDHP